MKTDKITLSEYEEIDVFREGVCWVKADGKWGLINSQGSTIIKPQYDDIREFNEGFGYFKKSGRWGLVDKCGNEVFEPIFSSILMIREGMALVKINGKYGFADLTNSKILTSVYDEAHVFSEGLAAVKLNGKWGFIDKSGRMVINPEFYLKPPFFTFNRVRGEEDATIFVGKTGPDDQEWEGYIDKQGNQIGKWDEVEWEDYDSKWSYELDPWIENGIRTYCGLIDRVGNYVIKPKFQEMRPAVEGSFFVKIDDKWGLIDSRGNYLIEPSFDDIDYIGENRLRIWKNGKYGFADLSGRYLLNPLYHHTRFSRFKDGLIEICDDNSKYGFMDLEGNIVINPRFDFVAEFYDGMTIAEIDGKLGIIDKLGDFLVEPIYDAIENGFSCDRAWVKNEEKYGYVDRNGTMVIGTQFEDASGFQNGLAPVKIIDKWGLIDVEGNWKIEPKFDDIDEIMIGGKLLYGVKYNGKAGIIDSAGNYIIEPHYNTIIWNEKENIFTISYSEAGDWINSLLNDNDLTWGLKDHNGKWIRRLGKDNEEFQITGNRIEFSEGLAAVKINGKWGYIGVDGKIVIDPVFEDASNFEEGLATVRTEGKYGVINKKGKFISKERFENLSAHIKNGYIRVSVKNNYEIKWGVINKMGKYVLSPRFEYVFGNCNEGMLQIMEKELFGYADLETGNIIKPVFNYAFEFNNGLAIVRVTESQIEEGLFNQDILITGNTSDKRECRRDEVSTPPDCRQLSFDFGEDED